MRTPPAPILLTRELAATGERPDLLSRRAARGELVRLCRGAYARTEDLRPLTSGQRHLLSVLAVTLTGMLGDGAVLAEGWHRGAGTPHAEVVALREAAAAGFDPVFRRLWTFQFALREALMTLGMIDAVQFGLAHRNRGGRR